jgi:16S rRNA (guanine(966)-N(2))-methyltransferase RsmD
MRIIAGTHRGSRLVTPKGFDTRPTGDRVREAAFNLIGPLEGATVLDLFAGSGALGLEALSRGAASVTFVERGRPALAALRGNIQTLDVAAAATMVAVDVARFLTLAAVGTAPTWRWVFLDPPYAADVVTDSLAALPRARLTDDAVVVVEHAHRAPPPDRAGFLLRTDVRRYGDTELSLYRASPP